MDISKKHARISANNVAIKDNVEKIYEAGAKSGYDRFWDNYQLNGNRLFYGGAFSGGGWHKDTFYPKYNIVSSRYSTASMFANFNYATGYGLFDLEARLQELGVTLDISNTNQTTHMFQNAQISVVPELDFTKVGTLQYLCQDSKIKTFRKIKVAETTTYGNNFNNCTNLTDITFEGVIGQTGLNFNWSPLSVTSMKNIISCLKDLSGTAGEGVYTIQFSDTCWEALEADSTAPNGNTWENYVTSLGWIV